MRECGLKSGSGIGTGCGAGVTPRAGVWIEINAVSHTLSSQGVTPRAGVWIEIHLLRHLWYPHPSLPVRECGLKFPLDFSRNCMLPVTPRAGVWIEIVPF